MKPLRRLWRRTSNFITRSDERRLREEMEQHIALDAEARMREGIKPGEARRQALVKFGAVSAIRESYHAEKGLPLMDTVLQDLSYALRMLRKSPAFTIVAVLTLALGIGANAAIFTLVNALMLKNLPVTDPKALVRLGNHNDCCVGYGSSDAGELSFFSTNSYQYLRKNAPEFQDLAAMQAGFGYRPVVVRREGSQDAPRSVMGEFVSGNYFRTFGVVAATGRLFEDRDDQIGAPMTAVMSYATWRAAYHEDPSVIGATIRVNTKPVTIVGVAPDGFYGDRLLSTPPEYYLPIETMPPIASVAYVHGTETQWLYIIGRVRPGVPLAQLQQKVSDLLRQQIAGTRKNTSGEEEARLKRLHIVLTPAGGGTQAMQEEYNKHLKLLMGVSALVLLIACANIANLLLVRGMSRKAEINVRTAVAAGSCGSSLPKACSSPAQAGSLVLLLPTPERGCCSPSRFPMHKPSPSTPVLRRRCWLSPAPCRCSRECCLVWLRRGWHRKQNRLTRCAVHRDR